jgi:saccharopine dehydrogenase-like NADP-dependent oxidoreductase
MQVLVIGGSGVVGRGVVKGIANAEGVSRVVLTANSRIDKAKEIADEVGIKAEAVQLNVEDHPSMLKLMKDADLVLNMTGPASKYAVPVLKTALDAKKNYVDVNDDAESLPGLFALDDAAKKAGLTMLVCTGASPGQSNLLARHGADSLDYVDEINITWACGINIAADTPANWGHRLNMYAQRVPMFEDGKVVEVEGGSGALEMNWPLPVGRLVHRYCGHSEPITIPRYIKKGLKRVSCRGAVTPGDINDLFIYLGSLGLASPEAFKVGDKDISPFEFMSHYISSSIFQKTDFCKRLLELEKSIGPNFELNVEVIGKRNEKPTKIVCTQIGPDRNSATYIPTWVMAHMVISGEINKKGVFSPEALGLDPRPIIKEIEKQGGTYREEIIEV